MVSFRLRICLLVQYLHGKHSYDPRLYQIEPAFLWEYGKLLLFLQGVTETSSKRTSFFSKNMNVNLNDAKMIRKLEKPVLLENTIRILPV